MKRSELILTFIQVPLDFIALIAAGLLAHAIRFSEFFVAIKAPQFSFEPSWYLSVTLLTALAWLILFAMARLYTINPNRKLADDIGKIFLACSTALAAITIYIFFRGEFFNSRFIVLAAWFFAIILTVASHLLIRFIKGILYRFNIGARRTILIGSNTMNTLADFMQTHKWFGYNVLGVFENFTPQTKTELDATHKKYFIDEIIVDGSNRSADTLEALNFANENHITFKYSADLFASLSTNMAVSAIGGVPLIELKKTRLEGWGRIVKAMVDFFGAISFIIIFNPVMILSAIIILLESGRPIIYKNERVGRGGVKFNTLKFRSMRQKYSIGPQFHHQGKALQFEQELIKKQNIKQGPVYKIKDDPRVTPFGKLIRRFSIDEVPQFFNVLNGTMSLVGPRPHQPREVEKYLSHHKIALNIKPGITGLAQISGRSDLEFEEEARLDAFYTENWSLMMDLVILLKTPFAVLRKRKAL